MQVDEIIKQVDILVGQEIEVEGYIIVTEEAKNKIAFISTRHKMSHVDQQQIIIKHNLAQLKTIIRPLPTMQLMFRGVLTNPPYFYRFYAEFRATLDMDKDNHPILRHITEINLKIPYVGKTSELAVHDAYAYTAHINYTKTVIEESKRTAQAVITSQKQLLLSGENFEVENIAPDENRYARSIANQVVRVSGWLETHSSTNDIMTHLVLRTSAVRASMVAVGPLREMMMIWLRPSSIYKLLKTHCPFSINSPMHQFVEIIGEIDYLHDDDSPNLTPPLKLVFNKIHSIIIHEERYLW